MFASPHTETELSPKKPFHLEEPEVTVVTGGFTTFS